MKSRNNAMLTLVVYTESQERGAEQSAQNQLVSETVFLISNKINK